MQAEHDQAERAQVIFADAIERPAADRTDFVEKACTGDAALRAEVESLLVSHVSAGRFLEGPPALSTQEMADRPAGAHLPAAPVPARIGHYHVGRLIGSGGMGAVYEAMQEHPRRVVALKVMRHGLSSRSATRRFEHESEMLGRLHHPGIAQVYEAGTYHDGVGSVPFLVLEHIAGAQPITAYARLHALSLRDRLRLFVKVCEAIHHGHLRGIIHRDLKPSNILIDPSGQPKVIDYGVARAIDSDLATISQQTDAGQLVGTLQYMSPEQAGGGGAADMRDIDARSDVYSLGLILYELLCGRRPYDVSCVTISEATRLVREAPAAPPGTLDRTLRGDLDTIVLKALHKDRTRRYQSAAELGDDVSRFMDGEPIQARRDSLAYIIATRTRRRVVAHPVLSMLLAFVLAVVAVQTIGTRAVFDWTPCDRWFERALGWVPTGDAGALLEPVRVVAITDDTPVEKLAAAAGLEGVSWADFKSVRRLHGRLMERLAGSGVRAVVWDMYFSGDPAGDSGVSPNDAGFVAGIEALGRAKPPVPVLTGRAQGSWASDEETIGDVSRPIRRAVRVGGTTVDRLGPNRIVLDLAVERAPHDVVPSLPLATLLALRQPGAESRVFLDGPRGHAVSVYYLKPSRAVPGEWIPLPDPDVIPVSHIGVIRDEPEEGNEDLRVGDVAASTYLEIPSRAARDAATVRYEDVFTMSDADLRAAFDGRIAVISNQRSNAPDFLDPQTRLLHGSFGIALGIGALVTGHLPRSPSGLEGGAIVAAAAGAALAAALVIGPGWRRWIGAGMLALALTVGGSVVAYRLNYVCNPVMPLLGFSLASAMAIWVIRVRASSRLV